MKTKIVRGRKQLPIDYKVTLSFAIQQAEELGGARTSGEMTLPIRRGALDRLGKFKPKDAADFLRQLAEIVETGNYASLDPKFAAAMAGGFGAVKKGKPVAN